MDWIEIKEAVSDATAFSRDTLHILIGCGAHLGVVLIFRTWIGALWPVLLLTLAGLANEYGDLTSDYWTNGLRKYQWLESAKDMVLTIAIPLLLVLLSRVAPNRFRRPEPAPTPAPAPSE